MAKKQKIVQTKAKKKTAVARVRIKEGKGSIKLNSKPLEVLKPKEVQCLVREPLVIAEAILGEGFWKNLDIYINTNGGGVMGQAYASRTGIGKALVEWSGSEDLKDAYLERDRSLVIDDIRVKESKKCLRDGARAKPTKSYR